MITYAYISLLIDKGDGKSLISLDWGRIWLVLYLRLHNGKNLPKSASLQKKTGKFRKVSF
jgi:hypothetical protein